MANDAACRVRVARRQDVPALVDMRVACLGEAGRTDARLGQVPAARERTEAILPIWIEQPGRLLHVAEAPAAPGEPIGYALGRIEAAPPRFRQETIGEIVECYVRLADRGKGVGTTLLDALAVALALRGADVLCSRVPHAARPAVSRLSALGFEPLQTVFERRAERRRPMGQWLVRPARRGDLPSLVLLWQALAHELAQADARFSVHPDAPARTAASFATALDDPRRCLLVCAEAGRVLVGFAAGVAERGDGWRQPNTVGRIAELYVARVRRERGIGCRLVDRMVEALQRRGAEAIRATAGTRVEAACRFWERMGFAPLEAILEKKVESTC